MNKIKKTKRAVFFTIDAIIASLILLAGLFMMTKAYISDQPTVTLNYLAQDVLNVLAEMQVGQINNSYVQELIDNGTIEHLNNSILEQMGEFWIDGELGQAERFIENITYGLVSESYGFGVYINEEAIYRRSDIPEDNVVVARKIISGIEENKPINGYVARAVARVVDRNTSLVIPFSPQGAGWHGGWFDTVKWFDFTGNYNIHDVRFYVSAHIGNDDDDLLIDINNNPACHYDVTNMTVEKIEEDPGQGRGIFGVIDVANSCIINGLNNITVSMHNNQYNSHFHPGSFMVIDYYNDDVEVGEISSTVSEKIYFDEVKSYDSGNNGVFEIVPFEIPETATDIKVSIQVNTKNVKDFNGGTCCKVEGSTCIIRCRDVDYRIFLNTDETIHTVTEPEENYIYYYTPENTSSFLINGTNIVGVYLNNYDDHRFGYDDVQIYSDRFSDPVNSSYVEVNYTYTPAVSGGAIEVRQVQQFGGAWETPKICNFSFPEEAIAPSSVYAHVVQIFSSKLKAESDTINPPEHEIFMAPGIRIIPTTIYIPSSTISADYAATNYVQVEDTFGAPRYIGPNSTIDMGFYIRSFVTYAEVFMTEGEAVEDAQERLEELLGDYVDLEDIEFQNSSITEVPSLWGPAIIGVRIWT